MGCLSFSWRPSEDSAPSPMFRADLRTRFAGGVLGDAVKVGSDRFLNWEMECEMELQSENGRVEVRSDEGLIEVLINDFMAVLEDLKGSLTAAERNSTAEVCSDDRRFHIPFYVRQV
ncbi:fibronectin-binding A domain protein [Striga asiatica]|uniref:Fibronectin-binding A domain protein n=1 Tax=Striga asiatica TaxID=4170 RepID=A0A5A7PDG2_STRAF|nr:fibronectin-binding A domain protein [Striga asiatica]